MAKTLEQGFDGLIKWLVPAKSEHKKAVSHKKSIKSCFKNNFDCKLMFETGSFGNNTGVRHFSDTDYFAVCRDDNSINSSSYLLQKSKKALQITFRRTADKIRINSPSVTIPFGKYASENIEVTPCFYEGLVSTPHGRKKSYAIADGFDGWMFSSPQAHTAYVKAENKRLNKKLKPLIRLVKAWKFFHNVPISSFYLELRVTKFAGNKKKIVYDADLYRFRKKFYQMGLASIQDPMKVSGNVHACISEAKRRTSLSKLQTAYSRSEKAYEQRKKNLDKCFHWWNLFFNDKFPSR
ncbi:MAG: SMODS domain-containing nucleotidyltransferase [Aridibacter sp.]